MATCSRQYLGTNAKPPVQPAPFPDLRPPHITYSSEDSKEDFNKAPTPDKMNAHMPASSQILLPPDGWLGTDTSHKSRR